MHFVIAYGALIVGCGSALLLGRWPERSAAIGVLVSAVLAYAANWSTGWTFVEFKWTLLGIDLLLCICFAAIAFIADRFWPIPATALQLIAVAGHVLRLVRPDQHPLIYKIMVTAPYYPIMALLTWAAVRDYLRRRDPARPKDWSAFFPYSVLRTRRP